MLENERIERLREFSHEFSEVSEELDAFLRGKTSLDDDELDRLKELEGTLSSIALEWCRFTEVIK